MITTKEQAVELESKIETGLSEILGEEIQISMALTGRIKLCVDDGFMCLNRHDYSIDYFKYMGSYDYFVELYKNIKLFLAESKSDIDLLIYSYDNISRLE